MDKDADAFRTISEVGEELDLPQHVLRFWETRFPQIRPVKRGGGRRYYRPEDCDLLRGIKHLLYGEGYTIKGVQRILKEEGARTVQAVGRSGGSLQTAQTTRTEPQEPDQVSVLPSPLIASPTLDPLPKAPVPAQEPASPRPAPMRREPVFTQEPRASQPQAPLQVSPVQIPASESLRAAPERRAPKIDPAAPALPGFEPVALAPAHQRKAKPKQLALFAGMEEEGLSAKDRESLRQVLEKIAECRKLIASADLIETPALV